MTECYAAIAKNIKQIRLDHNMTQKEFAKELNLNTNYYAMLERGDNPKRRFTLEHIMIICKIHNVDPHTIITVLPDIPWLVQDCGNCKYCVFKVKWTCLKKDCKDFNLWKAKK